MPFVQSSGPEFLKLETDQTLPREVDVAIVGGGIIGVSAALTLAQRNVKVALFEKGLIAGEQSSRNWGWVRLAGRDLRELPLMLRAHELWGEMNALVGDDTGYRRCGILYASMTSAARERHTRWAAEAARYGIASHILEPSKLAAFAPGLTRQVAAALHTPADGRAEPQRATPLIARAAITSGAQIFQDCAVRTIDVEAGRVSGLLTEHGRVRASSVIVAGGAWSRLLLKGIGVTLPQLKVLSSVYRTLPIEAGIEPCMSFSSFAIRKRMDGGYTVASSSESVAEITPDTLRFFAKFLPAYLAERKGLTLRLGRAFIDEALRWQPRDADRPSIYEAIRILDPKPHQANIQRVHRALVEALPAFRGVGTAQSWAGMIDTTPDAIPVISSVSERPGLVVGTGFAGHGFGIGPAAGEMLADIAIGRTPLSDPHPLRFSRFTDGEKLHLQHWL
ncbi:FAD-binding oxidoreductase [Mesorhizobium sp. YR577]|uniref:NAD(P)/FAD-dependent oxidoreductase n=1 Tax=Mesorhizobium sp. YR577 TaxID=1884373 RepID=UPI0008DF655C|nr:FAD-binding oxidoreductase [Mesorhizobium sp. YR577]SFU21175.1 Glycine/D-amino acid oxidase [Mesorhizobium sp. YR577]